MRRTIVPVALALLSLPMTAALAQAQPNACRVYIEVAGDVVQPVTQRADCKFTRTVIFVAVNLDNADRVVVINNFRFNPQNPAVCDKTVKTTSSPFRGSARDVRIEVDAEDTNTEKKTAKDRGSFAKECYEFDVVLQTRAGRELHRLDPELQISEPSPLNPPKKP